MLISKGEYAKHRGVSAAMVSHWTKAGRIVIVEKKVDVAASDAALAASLDPARGGKNGKSNGTPATVSALPGAASNAVAPVVAADAYTRVRTEREGFRAKTEELEYREKIGEVVETARYDKALADSMTPILAGLDSLSARLGPALAAESDVRKIQNMIDDAVTSVRAEIADTLRRMVAGAAGTRQ